jgi:hypothetical protein
VADLILHVIDASAPEERIDEMIQSVEAVLREIGADALPVELVVNKIDAVDLLRRRRLANAFPDALQISAQTGEGLEDLKARIADRFAERFERVRLLIPYDEGAGSQSCTSSARRRGAARPRDGVEVIARLPRRELRRYARFLVAETTQASRPDDRAPVLRLRDDAVVPAHAYAGDAGSTSLHASASSSGRASAPAWGRGSRSRSRRATPASSSPRSASRRSTGSRS